MNTANETGQAKLSGVPDRAETTPNDPETTPLPLKGAALKTSVFTTLYQNGFPADLAHQIANRGKKATPKAVYIAKRKSESYALAKPKLIRKAELAVKETLDMVPVKSLEIKGNNGETIETKMVYPTVTNRLAAAQMVLDRADPIHHVHESVGTGDDLGPLDLAAFELIPRESVIDGESEVISEDNQVHGPVAFAFEEGNREGGEGVF